MAAAAFTSDPQPVMANYIPVWTTDIPAGLIVVASGAGLLCCGRWWQRRQADRRPRGVAFWHQCGGSRGRRRAVCLCWSYCVAAFAGGQGLYYEILFWVVAMRCSLWTLLMLVCWLWLGQPGRPAAAVAAACSPDVRAGPGRSVRDALRLSGVRHRDLSIATCMRAMRLGGGLAIVPHHTCCGRGITVVRQMPQPKRCAPP